jgi:hypothetical protein
MKSTPLKLFLLSLAVFAAANIRGLAQDAKPAPNSTAKTSELAPPPQKDEKAYSGMYTFLKDGEFVQVTVEDDNSVTGFISRYGEGESDKGAFLDQFFKSGKLDGNKLTFTTELVHGVGFDFKGTVERGDGKSAGEDGYFVLKGTLTQNVSDVNKKVTSHSQPVALKKFPEDSEPVPSARK